MNGPRCIADLQLDLNPVLVILELRGEIAQHLAEQFVEFNFGHLGGLGCDGYFD
jgi:hypothetical protein